MWMHAYRLSRGAPALVGGVCLVNGAQRILRQYWQFGVSLAQIKRQRVGSEQVAARQQGEFMRAGVQHRFVAEGTGGQQRFTQ